MLIDVRTETGLSQRDLAELLGKPRSFVSKLESRERRLDVVEMIAYAKALGVAPGDLIDRIASVLDDPIIF